MSDVEDQAEGLLADLAKARNVIEQAAHILDTLSAGGFVVVELPTPDTEGEHSAPTFSHPVAVWFTDEHYDSVQTCCGLVELHGGNVSPDKARIVAAALLAAADAADRAGDDGEGR